MTLCTKKKQIVAAVAVALVAFTAGLVMMLLSPASSESADNHPSHAQWIILLPIYTSLIPIYLAAMRRRKNKKNNG